MFPDRSGEGVRLCLAALPDKEPGFRAALCDLRLEDGVARASWALFGGDSTEHNLGNWLEGLLPEVPWLERAAASRWLAQAAHSRLGARRLQSALKPRIGGRAATLERRALFHKSALGAADAGSEGPPLREMREARSRAQSRRTSCGLELLMALASSSLRS